MCVCFCSLLTGAACHDNGVLLCEVGLRKGHCPMSKAVTLSLLASDRRVETSPK